MKRFFFVAAFGILAAASSACAQQMMIGVRGGVNLADQYWSSPNYNNITIHLGVLAGMQADYRFDSTWAISFQALFDQKGSEAPVEAANGPAGSGGATWTGNYIEVPILVKASSSPSTSSIYFFVGPSVGLLLSNTEVLGGGYFPYGVAVGPATVNISDSTNKLDLSIVGGIGISFPFKSGIQLFGDVAYAYGLLNTDNYRNDNVNGISVYSRDIRLAAGIMFPIR